MRLFKGFALAFNMLSVIPFFKVHDFFKGINGYSAMFYPLVGFILGSILWATHSLLYNHMPSTHLAVVIFGMWVLITGALHLDGFSDTIDELFVSSIFDTELLLTQKRDFGKNPFSPCIFKPPTTQEENGSDLKN